MENNESCEWTDFGCHLSWLAEELRLIFLSIYESILGGMATLLEAMPVPDFITDLLNSGWVIPPEVLFWTDFFQLPYGILVFTSALTLRFVLRRIPIIG